MEKKLAPVTTTPHNIKTTQPGDIARLLAGTHPCSGCLFQRYCSEDLVDAKDCPRGLLVE